MEKARRASIRVIYKSKDITKEISQYVKSFNYSDAIDGEADNATITLIDREEIWIDEWFPEKGESMEISIISGVDELELGTFEIDEIENTLKPSEARIKLISVPSKSEIRWINRSRSWEKVRLSSIASDIASESGLSLNYDTTDDPIIERIEQDEESDIKILKKVCKNRGLGLKITDGELIIYDKEKLEKSRITKKIEKNSREIIQFSLKTTIHEVYGSCKVEYMHGKKDKKISSEYVSRTDRMTLKVSEKVENEGEAERLAKKKLREKNEKETTGSFTLIGDCDLVSGNVIELTGFHVYDGRYIIDKSTHDISSGYTTKIEVHKCLNGY